MTQPKTEAKSLYRNRTACLCCMEVITDLQIKLPGKNHRDFLEVKVHGGAESCLLTLPAYRRMFPGNLTNNSLPKGNAL